MDSKFLKSPSTWVSLWAMLLPFWSTGSTAIMLLLLLMLLSKKDPALPRGMAWFPVLAFAVIALSVWWMPTSDGWAELLVQKSPLLLMPIVLVGQKDALARGFRWSAVLVVLYLMAHLTWGLAFGQWIDLTYRGLSEGLHQHVYLSLVLALGLLLTWKMPNDWTPRMKWALTVTATLCIALMGSRIAMLAMLCGCLVAGLTWNRKTLGLLIAALLLFTLAQSTGQLRGMGPVFTTVKPHWATGSVDTRLVQADATWQLIKPSPWTGVGVAPLQPMLENVYQTMDYRFGLKNHLNSHNQLLHLIASHGFIGLLLMLIGLTALWWRHRPVLDRVGWAILLAFALVMMTENLLERSLGLQLWVAVWVYVFARSSAMQTKT